MLRKLLRVVLATRVHRFTGETLTRPLACALGFGGAALSISVVGYCSSQREDRRNFVISEVDKLYDGYLIDNAYAILRRYEESDDSELLWRLARVLCERGKLSSDKEQRKSLFYEAYNIVQRAVDKEPKEGCAGAHKWMAIILDYVGEVEGNKSRIQKSVAVRDHLEKAIATDPTDATTIHILGLWHFSFADMSYAVRLAAKAFFATPPSSSYEDALKCFLSAEEIQPNFYSTNTFYIAEVYDRLGKKADAIAWYKKAFKMAVISADDRIAHEKAFEKLKKAGVKVAELV